jgi:hypothetical protein
MTGVGWTGVGSSDIHLVSSLVPSCLSKLQKRRPSGAHIHGVQLAYVPSDCASQGVPLPVMSMCSRTVRMMWWR